MKKIYLDNASTTPLRKEVIDSMIESMEADFGNPSSSHSFGRTAKNSLEISRKQIAKFFNVSGSEIIFTSGATEANNWILNSAVKNLNVNRIITSKIEHHAVLYPVQKIEMEHNIQIDYVNINPDGSVDLAHLVKLLQQNLPTLVSLMHVNNETGVVLDLEKTAQICEQYKAFFHSDTVQSIGKTTIDLSKIPLHFLVASAHKFHGPKGIGFAFVRKGLTLNPMIVGGEQEKGLRAGTEPIHDIVGMTKALEISESLHQNETNFVLELKNYCIKRLFEVFPALKINGNETCFYNILNVMLPLDVNKTSLLLFNLDMKGIAVSRGSACQSGSQKPSHVLAQMLSESDLLLPSIRISFSHFNTFNEIDYFISVLKSI
jgi:cysteine desulfurase